jgi:hypothetical protein
MYFCVQCRCVMRCDKNEVGARYGTSHVYPGDRFKCPKCGMMILACNKAPVFLPAPTASVEFLDIPDGQVGQTRLSDRQGGAQ